MGIMGCTIICDQITHKKNGILQKKNLQLDKLKDKWFEGFEGLY